MRDFKTKNPEIRVLYRNQAYFDPSNMFPIFREEWTAFDSAHKPHNQTMLNGHFASPEWGLFNYPKGYRNHASLRGANIILQQHFNTICKIPEVPIAHSVLQFPLQPPCVYTKGIDFYIGTTMPGVYTRTIRHPNPNPIPKPTPNPNPKP
jgi:hypothetical protein